MTIALDQARTIILFLPHSDPKGIRIANIQMSTIQALAFRADEKDTLLDDFSDLLKRPGVYILVGEDENGRPVLRNGQSENVRKSLGEHKRRSSKLAESDTDNDNDNDNDEIYRFWTTTLAFTSKDETLTTGHIRYIEAQLTDNASKNLEIDVKKGQTPSRDAGGLPLHERATAEAFVSQVALLSDTLGYSFFTSSDLKVASVDPNQTDQPAIETAVVSENAAPSTNNATFTYQNHDVLAKMNSDGVSIFRVLKESKARKVEAKALPSASQALRARLLKEGILDEKNGKYVFQKDYDFRTLASATQTVSGTTEWGKQVWKLENGNKTLGAWLGEKSNSDDLSETSDSNENQQ